jgi:hypothetical protein
MALLGQVECRLTPCWFHTEVSLASVEADDGKALERGLGLGRGVDAVTSGPEVAAGNNYGAINMAATADRSPLTLKGIANVDYKGTGAVLDVAPDLIPAPDLQAGDGDREQQRRGAKVGVAEHTQALAHARILRLEGVKEGVTEVTLVDGTRVTLDVVPKVVIGHFEHHGEQPEESPVHGASEVLCERGDLVHEWVDAGRDLVQGLKLLVVEVELANAVGFALDSLSR